MNRVRERMLRRCANVVCVALLATQSVCSDQGPDDGPGLTVPDLTVTELPTTPQVSNPVAPAGATGGNAVRLLSAESAENFVYVSLPTDAAPGGVRARIRRVGDEVPITVGVQDGGFDPIAVRAGPGDSIEIVVTDLNGGEVLSTVALVSSSRRPVVVRTWPPRKKSDIPVNLTAVVVFSEPLDKATVTDSSVRLFTGRSEVAGQVRVLDGGTSVAFTPTAPLSPQREYRLVIGKTIADLQGETLGEDVVVGFTTGTSFAGPPASIAVSPDSAFLLAGSSYQFSAHVFDAAGNLLVVPVTWKASTLDAISISQTGLATGKQSFFINRATWAVGTVEAIVGTESRSAYDSTSGISSAVHVVVVPQPGSIEVVPSAAALAVGDTLAFEVVTRATNEVFSSRIMVPLTIGNSNPAAASVSVPALSAIQVSPLRTLKALAPGATRITVKAGGLSAALDVTVTQQLPVAAVRVAPAAAEMMAQETLQLTAWLRDTEGKVIQEVRSITWQSSNASVATVDAAGRVTAVGNGSATISATSEGKAGSTSIAVSTQPAGPTFVALSASWQTCGVTSAKDTYCWGRFYNAGASFEDLRVPTLLPGGIDLVDMKPGGSTPGLLCGRANAGETFCWAYYNSVPTRFAPALTFSDLSVSSSGHACGVATNGTTYCWGRNTAGQLGDGTTQSRPGTPTPVAGGHAFKSITVGRGEHSCGLTAAGDAYCWGNNAYWTGDLAVGYLRGLLGTGDTTVNVIPTPSRVAGGHVFAELSAGMYHTCGITLDGKAYCWGHNSSGQLGDGTVALRTVPTAVATALTFTAISTGTFLTCAIAVGGAAYCWGSNSSGSLGVDGENRRQPVAVQGNLSFVRLAAGALHACGITAAGRAYCWGDNTAGKLGDGSTTTQRSMPMPVARPNP